MRAGEIMSARKVWRSRCPSGEVWVAECVDELTPPAVVVCPTCGGSLSWWLALGAANAT